MYITQRLDRINPLFKQGIVYEYERGLLYRNGQFVKLLSPGRYRFLRWEPVTLQVIDMRQSSQIIMGQEMLTADKIDVRVTVIVHLKVADPVMMAHTVSVPYDRLYQDMQLSLRAAISTRELDNLLQARDELSEELLAGIQPMAAGYGVTIVQVGIRDMILPGNIREAMFKELMADREGRADLIRARHEVASARARANTAKILQENPMVARLQELDVLAKMAAQEGNVVLLPNLASLLVQATKSES